MRPLVSIIVPTYNAEGYIEETLESALRQTYRPTELIVVDDGSTDGTLSLVQRLGSCVKVVTQENSGVCVARNHGVARSDGTVLAFLDADDIWEPDKIEKQVGIFEQHPEVGLVAVNYDEIDASGKKLRRKLKQPTQLFNRVVNLHRTLLQDGNFLSLSACMISRNAFEQAGGFYTKKRILSGDYDLWIRVSEQHLAFVISEILCHYRVLPDSQIHGSLEKEYGAQRRILEKHRHRFSDSAFRRRLSRLYCDWADSAFFEGKSEGWPVWRKALGYDPANLDAWFLGARVASRRIFGRFRPASSAET